MIYFDYNATSPVHPRVVEVMCRSLRTDWANPSSPHAAGRIARKAVDEAREQVGALAGCDPSRVVFTSGGTESDNLALVGSAIMGRRSGRGTHVITVATEHHAVLHTASSLERQGFSVTVLPVTETGRVSPDDLVDAVTDDTVCVSIMLANNETGVIQDIPALAAIAREAGALFHTDAVQAAGKLDLDMEALGVDLLSLSGHKIMGPKGVGVLCIRRRTPISGILFGGNHERGMRAGTENVPGIVGMGEAARLILEEGLYAKDRIRNLRDRLLEGICDVVPEVVVNGVPEEGLPNTLNVSFPGVDGQALHANLDLKELAVSGASACSSGAMAPSHVLCAMGLSHELAQAAVRFSLGPYSTSEEVDQAIAIIGEVVPRLQSGSAAPGQTKSAAN